MQAIALTDFQYGAVSATRGAPVEIASEVVARDMAKAGLVELVEPLEVKLAPPHPNKMKPAAPANKAQKAA